MAHFFFGPNLPASEQTLGAMAARQQGNLVDIRSAAERVASSLGLDVVDVEFTGTAKQRTLCIYLEKDSAGRTAQAEAAAAQFKAIAESPEDAGGIDPELAMPERFLSGELDPRQLSWLTHEDCAAFSRDFGTLLDVEDLIPEGEYTLEASSPGLDRKLTRREDFERFQNNLVKIQTREPIANNRHWQGRYKIAGAEHPEAILLDLSAARQNSKSRKTGVSTVVIALGNIEKAQLVPEF